MLISAAGRTVTNLPTAARGPGVFAGATGGGFWVLEVGVFNTTTTAVAGGVLLCTATGTQVGGLTEVIEDDQSNGNAPAETAFTSQSSDSTGTIIRQFSLGAAVGSGLVMTWAPRELLISEGTANGIIISCPTGTAQHLDFWIKWGK